MQNVEKKNRRAIQWSLAKNSSSVSHSTAEDEQILEKEENCSQFLSAPKNFFPVRTYVCNQWLSLKKTDYARYLIDRDTNPMIPTHYNESWFGPLPSLCIQRSVGVFKVSRCVPNFLTYILVVQNLRMMRQEKGKNSERILNGKIWIRN